MKKKLLGILMLIFLVVPFQAGAHGEEAFEDLRGNGPAMMQFIEDQAVGTTRHEEMEALMEKMMSGSLSEAEAGQMVTYMRSYPGTYGQMVGRMGMMRSGNVEIGYGSGMMGNFGGGTWSSVMYLGVLVWLVAGVLLILFLMRRISGEKGQVGSK